MVHREFLKECNYMENKLIAIEQLNKQLDNGIKRLEYVIKVLKVCLAVEGIAVCVLAFVIIRNLIR